MAVDLPDGRTLFALLRSVISPDWSAHIMHVLAPDTPGESYVETLDDALLVTEATEVPRTYMSAKDISSYPMLVTFGDLDDPTSVERVDPDDLAASFGEGVALKRITVQITDDPVTTGIEGRLGVVSRVGKHRWRPDANGGK